MEMKEDILHKLIPLVGKERYVDINRKEENSSRSEIKKHIDNTSRNVRGGQRKEGN